MKKSIIWGGGRNASKTLPFIKLSFALCLGVLLLLSCSVVSESHGLQHARLPWPSPSPRACSNSCPLIWWCHPTISSSVIPFSYHLQSFPASGSFPVSRLFASGGQSIGASASTSVLPMNIQGWVFFFFFLGLTKTSSIYWSKIRNKQRIGKYIFLLPRAENLLKQLESLTY